MVFWKQITRRSHALFIVRSRGQVADENVERVRQAGYSDGEIAEIVVNVVLNIFTNYFNLVVQTEVDFPRVALFAESSC